MTEITTAGSERHNGGMSRQKKHDPKTDMTPMVDLGFLPISFFVITTEMTRPTTTDLAMPKEGSPLKLGESDALTVLLGKNSTLYYYHGDWDKASTTNRVFKTNLSIKDGLRRVIREKQRLLDEINKKEGRKGLMLLIKPGEHADYGRLVDLLDEALIHNVKKYAVVKPEPGESSFLDRNE